MGNPFREALDVRRVDVGRYEGEIADRWTLWPLPQGGIVSAIALRAMADELGRDDQRPRTLHTMFAAQVAHGPVEIDVEVLRAGRTMSHARAEVRNPGAARGHVTTCAFGGTREGFSFTDLRPPDVIPPPGECPSYRDPPPPGVEIDLGDQAPFWGELVEGRPFLGSAPWEDDVARDRAERGTWYRFDDPPFLDDGRLDPLSLVVLADTMPGAVGEKVGPGDRDWFAPSVDLTVHLLDDCRSSWVLAHNKARFAGEGYASTDMALWDCGDDGTGEPRLVAYATQVCLFTFR